MRKHKPNTKAEWSLAAIFPMEYDSYNPGVMDTLTGLRDLIPTIASTYAQKAATRAIREL